MGEEDKPISLILIILLALVLIPVGFYGFLLLALQATENIGKSEIKPSMPGEYIKDIDMKKIYDAVFAFCKQDAESGEDIIMGSKQSRDPNEIANVIARAVKDCNGEEPSLPTGPNPDLKYINSCQGGSNIEYNCGSDNKCTSDAEKTLVIYYDAETLPTIDDNIMFCDSDAT